jgi:hypothetical protein
MMNCWAFAVPAFGDNSAGDRRSIIALFYVISIAQ